jgi:hypothetical protein
MRTTFVGIGVAIAIAGAAGCSAQPQGFDVGDIGPNGGNPGRGIQAASDPDASASSGLPCDVEQYLAANCQSCHGYNLSGGAPSSLVTYADLTGKDKNDLTKTTAQECVLRMQSAGSPMPPGQHPSATDVAILQNWINAGYPMGNCGAPDGGAGGGLANGPTVCTSGTTWNGQDGTSMRPGEACNACHSTRGVRTFAIAGTVYATAHEPNDCNGTNAAPQVVITDKNGVVTKISVDSVGNFAWSGSLATPYTASVVYGGKTRAMASKQTNGDCNSCHTTAGTSGAPGRVALP